MTDSQHKTADILLGHINTGTTIEDRAASVKTYSEFLAACEAFHRSESGRKFWTDLAEKKTQPRII